MEFQSTRKRRYFPVPSDQSEIEECLENGAEYDEALHELFIYHWQHPLDFLPYFENGSVPEVTDLAITETRGNVIEVNFDWSVDEQAHQHMETDDEQRKSFMSDKKVYLDCPYQDKDECKALGGRWDPEYRKWYVPAGMDLDPFRIWWPGDTQQKAANTPASIDQPIEQE